MTASELTADECQPTASAAPLFYQLNAVERLILVAQRALREHEQPGWPIQMHVWLSQRVDVERLRVGLRRLNVLYPMLTSRIAENGNRPVWKTRPDAECVLHEIELESSERDAVLRAAEQLLVEPVDLDRCDPIRFYLLHLPDGRDVFLFEYDHTLMDANAALPLLKELSRQALADCDPTAPLPVPNDEIEAFIRRFSFKQRVGAMWQLICAFVRRGSEPPITIGPIAQPIRANPTLALRVLSVEQSAALASRVERLTGVASISMAILSGALRAVAKLTTQPFGPKSVFAAPLGLKLRRAASSRCIVANLLAIIAVRIPTSELVDFNRALIAACASFQEQLTRRLDLAGLILVRWLKYNGRAVRRGSRDACLKIGNESLRYGYFGSLAAPDEKFMGVYVELAYKTALAMPPWGLLLWANQSGGKIVLSAVYHREQISDETMERFLDYVVADLTAVPASAQPRPV